VAYWTAAHEAVEGRDPLRRRTCAGARAAARVRAAQPLIMRNPPWAVPVIVFLGLLPSGAAQGLWLVAGVLAVLVAARWLWGVYQAKGESRWTPWLATAVFLPVAVALAIGQMSPLVLLGIAGFLHFEKKKTRPRGLGACDFVRLVFRTDCPPVVRVPSRGMADNKPPINVGRRCHLVLLDERHRARVYSGASDDILVGVDCSGLVRVVWTLPCVRQERRNDYCVDCSCEVS
jgi:Glycosyltransferase family 87